MKKILFIILLVGLSAPFSRAQNSGSDVNIQQVSSQISESRSFSNGTLFTADNLDGVFLNSSFVAGLQQLSIDANQVAHINLKGDNNIAQLTQSGGIGNVGLINVTGNGNTARLSQDGNSLLSAINIEGNSNQLDVNQRGNNLQNLLLLDGSGLNFNVKQDASGVKLTQTGSSVPLQITSSGGGKVIPIIIHNN